MVEKERTRKKTVVTQTKTIQFVKEEQDPAKTKKSKPPLLDKSIDWELRVDLDRRLVFPNVVETTLRPDKGVKDIDSSRANHARGG
jgi:hypothetical protein